MAFLVGEVEGPGIVWICGSVDVVESELGAVEMDGSGG
jgi:hypothetical protein